MTLPDALQDLLTITALEQVTPQRIQAWQAAVRTLAGPAPMPDEASLAPTPDDETGDDA